MTLSVTRCDVTLCRAVVCDAAQHDVARLQFKAGVDRYDDLRFPRNLLCCGRCVSKRWHDSDRRLI